MRRSFSIRQVFVIAMGVGLAVALAPMAVDAASKAAGLTSKKGRAVAVDKKGRMAVAVKNRPKVVVPGGVAVTNKPTVEIGNQPTVEIGNQPTVTVANQPSELAVSAQPGKLTATTRPPLDDVFNSHVVDVQSLIGRRVLALPASRRAAVTHLAATVEGAGVDQETIVQLIRYVRVSGSNECGQAGWEATPLRRIVLKTEQTYSLDLAAAPIVVRPDDEGRPVCLAMKLYQWVADTRVSFAADGYLF